MDYLHVSPTTLALLADFSSMLDKQRPSGATMDPGLKTFGTIPLRWKLFT